MAVEAVLFSATAPVVIILKMRAIHVIKVIDAIDIIEITEMIDVIDAIERVGEGMVIVK